MKPYVIFMRHHEVFSTGMWGREIVVTSETVSSPTDPQEFFLDTLITHADQGNYVDGPFVEKNLEGYLAIVELPYGKSVDIYLVPQDKVRGLRIMNVVNKNIANDPSTWVECYPLQKFLVEGGYLTVEEIDNISLVD